MGLLRKTPFRRTLRSRKDPHQVNNLANDPRFADELKHHRDLLNKWIKETGDKGEQPESREHLRAIYKRWGSKCVNPEFDIFKKEDGK
jgi:hypothetical protein